MSWRLGRMEKRGLKWYPKEGTDMIIEERLNALEWELASTKRRYRWQLAIMGLAIVVVGLTWTLTMTTPAAHAQAADAGPKVVRANEFILETENGEVRAKLFTGADGAALSLSDKNGRTRAALIGSAVGPLLVMFDENGAPRATLAATADGPSLVLRDDDGESRAALVTTALGPALSLFDENEKVRMLLSVGVPRGEPEQPSLFLYDRSGTTVWYAP